MSVLPSQKLTIGELYLSMAVGLVLFLTPNDIHNAVSLEDVSEGLVALAVAVITAVFVLIIKRYEAVGAALLTHSVITIVSFTFGAVNGFITKGANFWPTISNYQLNTLLIVWSIPFFMMVILRLALKGPRDSNDQRAGFVRFLSLSLRALIILYLFIILFRQIIPNAPDMVSARKISYLPFAKIQECLATVNEGGIAYLIWHCLILMPLTFSLLILNPKIRWWQLLIISLAFGLTLEILQFSLNTDTVYTDDLLMYLVGGTLGFLLKYLIDGIRSVITGGAERSILSMNFTPIQIMDEADEEKEEALPEEIVTAPLPAEVPVKTVIGFENAVKAVEESSAVKNDIETAENLTVTEHPAQIAEELPVSEQEVPTTADSVSVGHEVQAIEEAAAELVMVEESKTADPASDKKNDISVTEPSVENE